jgi:cobalamin biosynthesis Mg chelatase CobN
LLFRTIPLPRYGYLEPVLDFRQPPSRSVELELTRSEAVGVWAALPGASQMATKKDGRIVETATEARQAEPGPSILVILIVSVVLAAIVLAAVWFIFFRT